VGDLPLLAQGSQVLLAETNASIAGALQGNALIQLGLPISLFIIMVGVGLSLRPRDFHNVVYYPAALILGSIAQILVLPLLGVALAYTFRVPPAIAVGLVIIAACPGGTTSNVFAFLGKGNLALSILMTAIASLITVMTLPLFTNWAIELFKQEALEQPLQLPFLKTVVMLLAVVFVPVILGMGLRAWKRQLAGKLEGVVGAFGLVVLFSLVVLIVYQTRDHLGALILQAGPSVLALNVLGICIGFVAAKLAKANFADGLTLALELGIKNSTIGLTVALTLLGSADIAAPAALYGILMFISAGALAALGRRHAHVSLRPTPGEVPRHLPDDVGFPDDHPGKH
jgi:BASS family bile acid:Na+ symporter